MKKKVSIGLIVIGLILLILGGVFSFTSKVDDNNDDSSKVVDSNKNNGEPIISEDGCDVVQTNKGYVDTELSSWCEEFHLDVDGLKFNFVKDEVGMFNLEVVYKDKVSYSSLTNGKTIYSDEQAGHTRIKKIDDLYFIDTAAAAQCGYIGSLIVVTSTGEFIGGIAGENTGTIQDCYNNADIGNGFSTGGIVGKNGNIDKDYKEVTYYIDPNNTCGNINNLQLIKVVYTVKGTDFIENK